jgi:flavodoxin
MGVSNSVVPTRGAAMRATVIYDTQHGNTRAIASVIAAELGSGAIALPVTAVRPELLERTDVLVVGSPVVRWNSTETIQAFLAGLTPRSLDGMRAAAFDTRVKHFIHGDAAVKISHSLQGAGATIVAHPQSFLVTGSRGPLAADARRKATAWAAFIGAELRATA